MLTEKTEKNRKKYICEKCNFISCDKKDYNKHILTSKHKNNTFVDISFTNLGKKTEKTEKPQAEMGRRSENGPVWSYRFFGLRIAKGAY